MARGNALLLLASLLALAACSKATGPAVQATAGGIVPFTATGSPWPALLEPSATHSGSQAGGRRLQQNLTPSGRIERPSPLAGDETGDGSGAAASPSPAIGGAAAPPPPPPPTEQPASNQGGCQFQPDTDFFGGDLPQPASIEEGVASAADCCSACQAYPGCGAFTWGLNEGRNRCFLKQPSGWSSRPGPGLTSGTVSGGTTTPTGGGGAPPSSPPQQQGGAPSGGGGGGQTISSPDGSCTAETGTNFASGDLAVRVGVNSAIDCCALCHTTKPCAAFTWGPTAGQNKCFLKFATGWDREPATDFTSGVTQ